MIATSLARRSLDPVLAWGMCEDASGAGRVLVS